MSQFVVSARKYRPATFDMVVGQEHITTTLRNGLKNNHLTHAYLFCGPRGVGKTTCARILAKTLNCINLTDTFEACNTCEYCEMINNGQSFNLQELDGASNNGVDEMRVLIEQVRYAPQSGKYKVVIIDEVHMLSTAAFNAFLKTLEEPPAHVIFILATTERHKIIPTILSRCQIFDFNRITVDDIAKQLKYIADKEGVNVDAEGLHRIAQKADGGMRDALSMFDQIVSFSGNNVSLKDVLSNLNVLDYEYYFKVIDMMAQGNYSGLLLLFDHLLNEGFDGHFFVAGISSHVRDLLVCKDPETTRLLTVSESVKEQYKNQSAQCDAEWLMALLDIFNKCDLEYKASRNQRMHVELTLMKACRVKKKLPELTEDFFAIEFLPLPLQKGEKSFVVAEPAASTITVPISLNPKPSYTASVNTGAVPTPTPLKRVATGARLMPSLRDLVKPQEVTAPSTIEVQTTPQKSMPFDVETLHKNIKLFAQGNAASASRNLYFTLTNHLPQLDNTQVLFVLDNKTQQEELMEVRVALLGYLKQQLQNDFITIDTLVITPSNQTKVPYTNEEKFQAMVAINPELLKWAKALDLEF